MATPMDQTPRSLKIPAWLTVIVVLLALAGAGWLVKRLVFTSGEGLDAITLDSSKMGNLRGDRRVAQTQRVIQSGPITVRPNEVFVNQGDILHLRVPTVAGKAIDLHSHAADGWTTRQQKEILFLAQRLLRQAENGRVILTPEQIAQLKALNLAVPADGVALKLDPADEAKLTALVKAWQDAPADGKAAAQKAMLDGIKEIGDRAEAAARKAAADTVARIEQIVTPEQMARVRQARAVQATRPAQTTAPRIVAPTTQPAGQGTGAAG